MKWVSALSKQADIDTAVKYIIDSAFGHAGQKCSASSPSIGSHRTMINYLIISKVIVLYQFS